MRRGLVAFIVLTLVGLGLTGCGLFRFEQREPWRTQAEQACLAQKLVQQTAYMSSASKIDGPGVCGMDYPFKVSAFSGGSVGLPRAVTLACPIIPQIDDWLESVVKPAALLYFGLPVVDLRASSYSCRPRNNQPGAKVSEHAFGNALDVMGFNLADGREVKVVSGWRGDPVEQAFLREVFVGACRYFSTVLGPGADQFHFDHLHLDLARHDPYGERRICKPIIKFTPRLEAVEAARQSRGPSPTADLPPIDMEEDRTGDDPSAPAGFPVRSSVGPVYSGGQTMRPALSVPPPVPMPPAALPSPPPRPASADPYRSQPVYNRPPVPAPGPTSPGPQILNGHGLY